MGPGESFGELALMYSTPRSATCKAIGKARLWALDRISFKVSAVEGESNSSESLSKTRPSRHKTSSNLQHALHAKLERVKL